MYLQLVDPSRHLQVDVPTGQFGLVQTPQSAGQLVQVSVPEHLPSPQKGAGVVVVVVVVVAFTASAADEQRNSPRRRGTRVDLLNRNPPPVLRECPAIASTEEAAFDVIMIFDRFFCFFVLLCVSCCCTMHYLFLGGFMLCRSGK